MKSMEIHGTPFNREKSSDQHRWLRFQVSQVQNLVHFVIFDPRQDPFFVFEAKVDQDCFLKMQKKQSIRTSFGDFPQRASTLVDYAIL
mmetsp:Transcript_42739/g.65652  ORF Transcript_42739/g.65652 Transcript_42739/m.65652 type:complete len:88 (+) Transcript_42739:556-819(+)